MEKEVKLCKDVARKPCVIKVQKIPAAANRAEDWDLYAGKKGKGKKLIGCINVWPSQDTSIQSAMDHLNNFADKGGYEIIGFLDPVEGLVDFEGHPID